MSFSDYWVSKFVYRLNKKCDDKYFSILYRHHYDDLLANQNLEIFNQSETEFLVAGWGLDDTAHFKRSYSSISALIL